MKNVGVQSLLQSAKNPSAATNVAELVKFKDKFKSRYLANERGLLKIEQLRRLY